MIGGRKCIPCQSQLTVTAMPADVLSSVFTFFGAGDVVGRLVHCSRKFYAIGSSEAFWAQMCQRDFPAVCNILKRTQSCNKVLKNVVDSTDSGHRSSSTYGFNCTGTTWAALYFRMLQSDGYQLSYFFHRVGV